MENNEDELLTNFKNYISQINNSDTCDLLNSILELLNLKNRHIKIADEYANLLWGILCDYDGYYDSKTKQGSLEGLASLVDTAMDICDKIRDKDDRSIIFKGNDNYNILYETINKEENNG